MEPGLSFSAFFSSSVLLVRFLRVTVAENIGKLGFERFILNKRRVA